MNVLFSTVVTAVLAVWSSLPALASQGPGASPGTATGFEQGMLVAAVAALLGFGLLMKFRSR